MNVAIKMQIVMVFLLFHSAPAAKPLRVKGFILFWAFIDTYRFIYVIDILMSPSL